MDSPLRFQGQVGTTNHGKLAQKEQSGVVTGAFLFVVFALRTDIYGKARSMALVGLQVSS